MKVDVEAIAQAEYYEGRSPHAVCDDMYLQFRDCSPTMSKLFADMGAAYNRKCNELSQMRRELRDALNELGRETN